MIGEGNLYNAALKHNIQSYVIGPDKNINFMNNIRPFWHKSINKYKFLECRRVFDISWWHGLNITIIRIGKKCLKIIGK